MPAPRGAASERALGLALRGGLALTALAVLVTLTGAAFHRYLVNDDYAALYTAWQESIHRVPGKDFVVYSDHLCMHVLAALIRAYPESFTALTVFRLGMVATVAVVAVLVFRITTRLFGPRSAWFAPPVFGLGTMFLNRALDVRSDLTATLLWLAAVAILVEPLADADARGERARVRLWLVVLGVVLGLMPVNFFKTALPVPLFVAWVALRRLWSVPKGAPRGPAVFDVAIVLFAAAVPVLAYAAYLRATGMLPAVLAATRAFYCTVRRFPDQVDARAQTMRLLLGHDPWIGTAIGVGVILRVDALRRYAVRENAGVFALLGLAALSVFANPAYYAYNLVTLVPLLAPFGGFAAARLVRFAEGTGRGAAAPLVGLLLFVVPLARAHRTLFELGFVPTNTHQLALHRYLLRQVPPDVGLFALDGVGVFRPSVVHFWLPFVGRPSYEAGQFHYRDELRARPAALVLRSYRLPWWLTAADRDFLRAHYVELNGDFMVPGAAVGYRTTADVELLVSGLYDVLSNSACIIDAREPTPGPLRLTQGVHRVDTFAACTLRLHVDPAARALLAVPTVVPYLVGPDYVVG